jgi:hypothetical protein
VAPFREALVVLSAVLIVLASPATAHADVPVGPARYVPCPPPTGEATQYQGVNEPYRCHSAVVDPLGNVVPDSQPFGVLTAYCKIPSKADPESKCPEWVNDSI